MDHSEFARLLPSRRKALLEEAVTRLPSPAVLETFRTNDNARTYASVRLPQHRLGQDEWVTYLVAFDHAKGGEVYFCNGNYGIFDADEAVRDMHDRANQ